MGAKRPSQRAGSEATENVSAERNIEGAKRPRMRAQSPRERNDQVDVPE